MVSLDEIHGVSIPQAVWIACNKQQETHYGKE